MTSFILIFFNDVSCAQLANQTQLLVEFKFLTISQFTFGFVFIYLIFVDRLIHAKPILNSNKFILNLP